MQTIKTKIMDIVLEIEKNEPENKYTPLVIERLVEAVFWFDRHTELKQTGVNQIMGLEKGK